MEKSIFDLLIFVVVSAVVNTSITGFIVRQYYDEKRKNLIEAFKEKM